MNTFAREMSLLKIERDIEALKVSIAELKRQRDDLQAANNVYLERARVAERKLAEAESRANRYGDAIARSML